MYGIGNISPSVNQTLTPSATLGAPGDMYIITDTRQRPRKDLSETKAFQRFDIEPYDGSEMPLPNENGVVLFPVKDLYFDTANFQNRDAEFSETSVNRILDAVNDGDFNWAIFDPITIWRNPDNGKFYVLSGHSRSEAFRRLSADGASVDGRNFDRIPAKIFAGTFEQAKELALNSNTLSTKETDLERANYYRERREKFATNGLKNSEIKKRLLELARKNEGKNATKIIYLSHLNPRGSVVDAVAATSDGASVDKNRVAVMAEWVGHLRYDFPMLTDFHERELFDFLKNGHYGVDVRNFNDFAKRVQTAIEKHTEWGVFDADKSLNLEKNLGKSENEKRFDAELDRLKSEWTDAENILNRKLADFKARQKRDASITDQQILQAVQPYKDAAILAKGAYFAFRDKRGDFLRADEAQMSLFGLGKPTIKFEFEDNAALADFLHATKKAADFADFEDVTNTATSAKANAPKSKIRNGKLMPADAPLYLPPSAGPASLPPSPTSPKALPPYRNVFPARQKFDKVKALYPDYIAFVKDGDYYITYDDDAKKIAPFLKTNLLKDKNGDAFVGFVDSALPINVAILNVEGLTCAVVYENGNVEIMQPPATNEPPVVKFTPKQPTRKKPEIEFDNIKYITRDMPAIWMDVPKSSITDHWLADWWEFAERKFHYPDDIVTFVQIDEKFNGRFNKKYYQFFFKDRDKNFVMQNVKNPKNVIIRDGGYFIVTTLADIERIEDALLDDGNRHLVIIEPHIYDDETLGKPTIKLEFEDNGELMSLFDTDGINGMTVNDKPADIFNCPESQLQTRGYQPTYIRLNDYSHLIDTADGRKTLKGYGFESATLDELVNACRYYPQVAALAAHLKDPNGDPLQTAFNIWHWLHTNVRYNYDTPGEEEIRTPARVWADRESGVDCDCLAVMTACLLINQGFHPCFEIVAFNNEPTFSHIYVNLDGAAIDRVLPVFLARPDNITKTQIMEIPVYSLSGIGGCRDTLSGVYSSTLAKIQSGTATGEDNNDFRKTQVLVTLRGIDDAAYSLAALLMPHVVTIADDGTYYFDSTAMANLATKLDDDLRQLIADDADPETISQWIANAAQQIDGAASVASNGGNDTVVVIINPKGDLTRVIGQMAKGDTPNLTDTTADAINTPAATASPSDDSPLYATTPAPIATPPADPEPESGNTWLWIAGISAAFGIGAALTSGSGKKKRR